MSPYSASQQTMLRHIVEADDDAAEWRGASPQLAAIRERDAIALRAIYRRRWPQAFMAYPPVIAASNAAALVRRYRETYPSFAAWVSAQYQK